MATNISKYVVLTDFLLLEYEFNRDDVEITFGAGQGGTPTIANTELGVKQFYAEDGLGSTNNTLILNSVPTNAARTSWYNNVSDSSGYFNFFDSSTAYSTPTSYNHDTVKVHIISGYNFDDIAGFLLQVRAEDTSSNMVDISNFTWLNQILGNSVIKFSTNTLYLGNKFYDKYVEFKIPSIQKLGGDLSVGFPADLAIKALSDVYLTYSTIISTDNDLYIIQELINLRLPVISAADDFNCFIAESTVGDYIEFYATWKDQIIGNYMSDIENGRIRLYTSNNPNDNYETFTNQYGVQSAKWVLMHEIYVYEHIPGGSSLLSQKFVFTQEDGFNDPNYFRPVLKNGDIASSYTIDYVCRLTNRMDGSQIIRKASFSSLDPKKYGQKFIRLNIENIIPYKIFNRIEGEKSTVFSQASEVRTKYVKVFFDTTNIVMNSNNTIFPQGSGPLFLKRGESIYNFKFDKLNINIDPPRQENVDLSGPYRYFLSFVTDDDTIIETEVTNSTNMNIVLGELEFRLQSNQINTLLNQSNNSFSIKVKNPDNSSYILYEGVYYDYRNFDQVISKYESLYNISSLQNEITSLKIENKTLRDENEILKAT